MPAVPAPARDNAPRGHCREAADSEAVLSRKRPAVSVCIQPIAMRFGERLAPLALLLRPRESVYFGAERGHTISLAWNEEQDQNGSVCQEDRLNRRTM